MFFFEVPTGTIGDKYGRKRSIQIPFETHRCQLSDGVYFGYDVDNNEMMQKLEYWLSHNSRRLFTFGNSKSRRLRESNPYGTFHDHDCCLRVPFQDMLDLVNETITPRNEGTYLVCNPHCEDRTIYSPSNVDDESFQPNKNIIIGTYLLGGDSSSNGIESIFPRIEFEDGMISDNWGKRFYVAQRLNPEQTDIELFEDVFEPCQRPILP